ncbi:MAG: hypothetical protein OEP95_14920 [Myxococcales bacterium]|nr:hypothetical protein [Myxococcales bacterium]
MKLLGLAAWLLAHAFGFLLLFVTGIVGWGWLADEEHAWDAPRAQGVEIGEPHALVPGPGMPPGLVLGAANNNLDWIRHDGRVYLGFRTAPRHWASPEARMVVLSAPSGAELEPQARWTPEVEFDLEDRDLREPRFLAIGDRLLFYFFEADSQPGVFAPNSIRVSERDGSGRWSDSRPIVEPGHVVWRTKWRRGEAWMSVYDGRELYEERGRARSVRLLRSGDGIDWTSVSGAESPVSLPGGGECAFDFDADGNLVALVRVEPRGALVCTAPKDRLEEWDCSPTPYRHDSPLLVRHGDRFFAIARRSLGGRVDRMPTLLPADWKLVLDQLRFWWTRLRTTVYEVLPDERRIVPLLDLPSRGDTAFASAIDLGNGRFAIANYSSPLEEPDWPWAVGQNVETRIYALELELPD